MAARKTWKDDTGKLEEIAKPLIKEDFLDLVGLNILYAWTDPPEEDSGTGRMLEGKVRRLPNRDRDLYGYDIAIVISSDLWHDKSDQERQKLLWHELHHIVVEEDPESGGLVLDKAGRVKISLRKHDLNMERFSGEIQKFGVSDDERAFIDHLVALPGYAKPFPCVCGHGDAAECNKAGRHLGPGVTDGQKKAKKGIKDTGTSSHTSNVKIESVEMAARGADE